MLKTTSYEIPFNSLLSHQTFSTNRSQTSRMYVPSSRWEVKVCKCGEKIIDTRIYYDNFLYNETNPKEIIRVIKQSFHTEQFLNISHIVSDFQCWSESKIGADVTTLILSFINHDLASASNGLCLSLQATGSENKGQTHRVCSVSPCAAFDCHCQHNDPSLFKKCIFRLSLEVEELRLERSHL
jgi:hypothetical protein